MTISTNTYIQDSVLLIRDVLIAGVSDPISSQRTGREKFIYTSYPQRDVKYPCITVRHIGGPGLRRMGMRSELYLVRLDIEVRVWARNEIERDSLTQLVVNTLRDNQFGTASTSDTNNLIAFDLTSSVPVDEVGEGAIKSQVMNFSYQYILGG